MHELETSVLKAFQREGLFRADKPFLLAISGGRDSVSLFHVLRKLKIPFESAHFNHLFRNNESKRDEEFLRKLTDETDIILHVKKRKGDIPQSNKQAVARKRRYEFLFEIQKKHELGLILTAHHLGDDVETLLYRLGKGYGIRGLKGIPYKTNKVFRPMLAVHPDVIEDYVVHEEVSWRKDSTNQQNIYIRNRIRQVLLPSFKFLNEDPVNTIGKSVRNLKIINEKIKGLSDQWINEYVTKKKNKIEVNLLSLKDHVWREDILHHLLIDYGFNYNQIKDILSAREEGNIIESENYVLVKYAEKLILHKKTKREGNNLLLNLEQEGILNNIKFKLSEIEPLDNYEKLDLSSVALPVTLRYWEPGDRIQPLGMTGHKKLSDLLTDKKVRPPERERIIIAVDAKENVIAVPGYIISEKNKVTPQTEAEFFLSWQEL